jgi:hypothetical protein
MMTASLLMSQLKDDVLANLARAANVAQFVSIRADDPNVPRHVCIRDFNGDASSLEDCIRQLLEASVESKVNVRTFSQTFSKGGEFITGLSDVQTVLSTIERITNSGISVIVNESIDIKDGGVSGVFFGNTVEFAPDDTPRCVEKPGVCRLPRDIGNKILYQVYGVSLPVGFAETQRVEFSIHPRRRGIQRSPLIIWEVELQAACDRQEDVQIMWPNRFSQHIGDKTFGLLVAYTLGHNTPFCTVVSRRIRPFVFGLSTGTNEFWCRTAPRRQLPGKLPTVLGHQDLFTLLESVDYSDRDALASVLVQEGVEARFSGGAAIRQSGDIVVEGVTGRGDGFMLGNDAPTYLPTVIQRDVKATISELRKVLGPCRMEWVHDGNKVWIVQVHVGGISSDPIRIVDGSADEWVDFYVDNGLECLRSLLSQMNLSRKGIRLIGDVGVTSHFGDLLRGFKVPSCLVRSEQSECR